MAEAGYNVEQVRELFRLIDWMMHLRDDWEQRFRTDLAAFEEQTQMPCIMSVERLAKAEGKAEGRAEGGIGVLLRQLETCVAQYRRMLSSGYAVCRTRRPRRSTKPC